MPFGAIHKRRRNILGGEEGLKFQARVQKLYFGKIEKKNFLFCNMPQVPLNLGFMQEKVQKGDLQK